MVSPREIIEDIRKNKYGIGLEIDPRSKTVIRNLTGIANRALEQLSEDLYSKDTHFVLELIQNADDNEYETAVSPWLKFTIHNEKILIQNNEKGFTEDNIRALCDVCKSTKSKKLGYIGEKGIGFKSVFRISDEPQIFSNGFRFKFKRKDAEDKLGFIVPHWIEDIPEFVDKKLTNIILPLRGNIKEELSKFNEIEPTLILFLCKLKRIEIHNITKNEHSKVELEVKDGRAEIKHSRGKECYKLVRKTLAVPENIRKQEEKRNDIEETELILAFPLKEDGTADATKEQKVFAYLPIRSYGLKFIVQADFLLPASREDIHKDKLWNKFLRDNIASVFLKAVDEFKQDEQLKRTYYNYIPLANAVTDEFFSPVVDQIRNNLRESECILTESGNWRKPQEVFRAAKDIRELIPNEALKKFFNKEYISFDIDNKENRQILDALGVSEFKFSHLVECLQKTEWTEWLEQQSDEWFVSLYSYLNGQELGKEELQKLKKLNILRLENNELASTIEKPVFSPLDKKGDYGFEKELRIIKRTIFEPKEKEVKEAVREFLCNIGVQDASPYEIIEHHILPIYESNDDSSNWKSKDTKLLLGYVRYIKDNLQSYEKESDKWLNSNKTLWEAKEDPLKRLKKSLYIRINKTVDGIDYYDLPKNIYLPKIYGNRNNLEDLFEGIEGISFVHREYIDDIIKKYRQVKRKEKKSKVRIKDKKEEIKKWREFFIKLGVSDGLKVEEPKQSYLTCEDKKRLRGPSYYYTCTNDRLTDYDLSHLQEILKRINKNKAKLFVNVLETQWKELSDYTQLKYEWFYYSWRGPVYADSTWLHLLKTSAWLPTSKGNLVRPSEVFIDKPDIRELLGDSVPYLAIEIKNEALVKTLGINSEANVEVVLNYLKSLVKQKCEDKTAFTKLYEFLNKKFNEKEEDVKTTFEKNLLIYIPATSQKHFTSQEVLWKDVSEIFGENRGYLEKHYPKLKSFFVDKLGVSEKPGPKDYADVLISLTRKEEVSRADEEIIWKIYKELNNHLNPETNDDLISEEEWWDDFISEPIFWTEKEEFWKNDDGVFVNDNQELYELFKNKPEIAFLRLPKNYYPKIQFFIEAVDIPYLSKAVKIELVSKEKPKVEENLTEQIQNFVPYILRYLYQQTNNDYERLKKDDTLTQLKNLKCFSVESLEVKYSVDGEFVFDKRSSLLYNGNLYIQKDRLEDIDHLAIELSKLFGDIRGLEEFLILLFEKKDKDKIESLLKAKGIGELPNDEQKLFGIDETIPEIKEPKKEEVPKCDGYRPSTQEPEIQVPSTRDILKDAKTKTEWSPDLLPEKAEVHIEQFQPPEVKPVVEKHKLSSIKPDTDKTLQISPEEEKSDSDTLSADAKKAIGRWGEEYALKCLKDVMSKKYPESELMETEDGFTIVFDDKILVEVHWLNKIEDKGEGYDIKVVENEIEKYIEVKSTKTEEKEWFIMSRTQWKFIQEQGEKFHIYRIYNAGTNHAKLVVVSNPKKLWEEGGLIAEPIRVKI